MPNPILMADSTDPWLIPGRFRTMNNGVAAYHDGPYKWPQHVLATFPRCWRITVEGDPAVAREARVLDVETLDVPPPAVPAYQDARQQLGESTTVYCNRSTAASVIADTPEWRDLYWWIATLDGQPWTAAELAADLASRWGAPIAVDRLAACQNMPLGSYDQSVVYIDPRWSKG